MSAEWDVKYEGFVVKLPARRYEALIRERDALRRERDLLLQRECHIPDTKDPQSRSGGEEST